MCDVTYANSKVPDQLEQSDMRTIQYVDKSMKPYVTDKGTVYLFQIRLRECAD